MPDLASDISETHPKKRISHPRTLVSLAVMLPVVACFSGERERASAQGGEPVLVMFNAGSLARPLRAALDSFAAKASVEIQQENAGSLETARKLTELRKVPDVIALADHEVFPRFLVPAHLTWYIQFARNRIVLAHTPRSRFADEITSENWWTVLQRAGVEVGRSDPNLDPAGYRTLLVLRLAERHYQSPGLYDRLLARSPPRNMRSKETDLIALVQAGEVDYAWEYESIAQATGLRYIRLPAAIDLGSAADSAGYASVSVRVAGKTPRDTVEFRGAPIIYAISIPENAPHPANAQQFLLFLLSADGKRILRGERLDVLERPVLIGSGAPSSIVNALTPR